MGHYNGISSLRLWFYVFQYDTPLAGSEIATSWSPMLLEIESWQPKIIGLVTIIKFEIAVQELEDFPFLFKLYLCFSLPTSCNSYFSVLKCLVFRTVEWLFSWLSYCLQRVYCSDRYNLMGAFYTHSLSSRLEY